jgi:hypothetical protein
MISHSEILKLDRCNLPDDTVSKGYVDVLVQETAFETEVICFKRQKYYAASTKQTYLAALPQGYEKGHFGPKLKAWMLSLYFDSLISEAKIQQLLTGLGVVIDYWRA